MRLKDLVFRSAKAMGIFALMRESSWRQRRLLILCYHGVAMDDEAEWDPQIYITQDRLRDRLRLLRDGGYHILPLTEALERLDKGTLPPKAVALTFDDGAVDFERRALPVLREFNAPATLYLTTYYCVKRLPVFTMMLNYVLWKGQGSGADVAALCESVTPLRIADTTQRFQARNALFAYAVNQKLSAQGKDDLVGRVAATLGVNYEDIRARGLLQIMTPDTVRSLPRDLVDVQLHTHRHRTPRDHELFTREITDNAAAIRELRGSATALEHFCYPSGEYYGEFLTWLPEQGVRYATTCVPGLTDRGTDPLLLPRLIDTMLQSALAFEASASGFAELLPRRREYRIDAARLALEPTTRFEPVPSVD